MKLISTNRTNLLSLEQFHHKPMGMYGDGVLNLALGGKLASSPPLELVRRVEMRFKDPPWWP